MMKRMFCLLLTVLMGVSCIFASAEDAQDNSADALTLAELQAFAARMQTLAMASTPLNDPRIAWQNKTPCVNSAEAAAHAGQEKDDGLHLILFPNPSGNSVEFPQNKHIKKPCGLNPQGNFYRERRTQTFQISFAYCAIVRSEENMPALAMFIRHLRAKDNSSR